jgi:hypothetical protein
LGSHQQGRKHLLKRHLLPGGERLGKDHWLQRFTHRCQRSLGQGAHRPGDDMINVAVHLFGHAKDRGGTQGLLLRCRQSGGDLEPRNLINSDGLGYGLIG